MRPSPFLLERYFATREFSAPYQLSGSDCETLSVGELLAFDPSAAQRLQELRLGYTESAGAPGLRAAVAGLYDGLPADGVLVHAGAQEGVFTLINAVLHPGDHAIVQWPCYQSLFELPRAAGAQVSAWRADPATWAPDLDELPRLVRPETRLLVVNSPHNPTGHHFDRETFDAIVALARRHGLMVLSDEVYRGLEYAAADQLPAMCDAYEHGVSLGVMSKAYGLAGLRIGWLATRDHRVLAAAAEVKDYTTICNSAPSELLATVALGAREMILARNRALVRANLARLREFFARRADVFRWVPPGAGSVTFPTVIGGDVDAFCSRILDGAGVLLLPGTVFDVESREVRLGFGRADVPEALSRLDAALGPPSP
ncbi:MAG TPA: aminotransferase class I/II-fold pyridoxal phosphate-dependent enzyme [Gemmatimonadaceae bacterium]|nr:aminotransferase class I/II-fold pyridoxal phosphate-dependent enzyme [Gemmatimonadaceae bacterium]